MNKKSILIIALLFVSVILLAQDDVTVTVRVESNQEAIGDITIYDYEPMTYIDGLENVEFEAIPDNEFNFDIPEQYDITELYVEVWASTCWSNSILEEGYGFYDSGAYIHPTCLITYYFDPPPDVSIFVETNSDVASGTVELFDDLGNSLGIVTTEWDNDDFDSDGITEVVFEEVVFDGCDYESMTAEASGTNVYDEYLLVPTYTDFVWNETEWRWEKDITMNYPLPFSESKQFTGGWNWISFPRLFRSGNQPFEAEIVVDELEPQALYIEAQDPDNHWMDYLIPGYSWEHHNLNDFKSSKGYKLEKSQTPYTTYLDVYGTQLPEQTIITLEGNNQENWVGYWLEETQTVNDAFGDYWDDPSFQKITAQYWSAVRFINNEWLIKKKAGYDATISYGEMVIIYCDDITHFKWDNSTPRDEKVVFSEPEYFSYDEKAEYIPIYVEIDPTDPPLEIGAKVNGECIGATVVEDTLTQINAYVEGAPAGNIEFELYYGGRAKNKTLVNYRCTSLHRPEEIKTNIPTRNMDSAYFVTLDGNSDLIPEVTKLSLSNHPNPFNPSTTIAYSIPNDDLVNLAIYNIKGQKVKQLISDQLSAGQHTVVWNGKDESGNSVSSGIYFYKLTTDEKTKIEKMIMLK